MKSTAKSITEGLKSRSELHGTSLGVANHHSGIRQLPLGLVSVKAPLKPTHPYRLREGDMVLFNNRICPVLRVTDCCAVIAMPQAAREFTTLFGKCVRIKPRPKLVRIGSNSEIPILKRRTPGGVVPRKSRSRRLQ